MARREDERRKRILSQAETAKGAGDLKALEAYRKELKELHKELKAGTALYEKLERDIAKVDKRIVDLRKSKSTLTKAAEELTTKLGKSGVAGSITRFVDESKNMTFSTDQATGKMRMFGRVTGMTVAKFSGYAAAIQLAIAATTAYMDALDKAQIKQANLQRQFGSLNVSIQESFQATAAGWAAAGKAGAEASEKLNQAFRRARGGVTEELGGVGGLGFERMTELTTGFTPRVTEYVRDLSEVFNIRTGRGMLTQLEELYRVVQQSDVPMERYADGIVNLAKEFANIEVQISDAADAVGVFEDAVSQQRMTLGLAERMAGMAMAQQLRAGGFEQRTLTASFAQEQWENMPEAVRTALNVAAGGEQTAERGAFTQMTGYEAGNLLAGVNQELYMQTLRAPYMQLRQIEEESGWGAAEQVAQQIGFGEWREFRKAFTETGEVDMDRLEELMMTPEEKEMEAARKQLEASLKQLEAADFAEKVAQGQKQWYSDFVAAWEKIKGTIFGVAETPAGKKGLETAAKYTAASFLGGPLIGGIQLLEPLAEAVGIGGEEERLREERAQAFREMYGVPAEAFREYQKGGAFERGEPLRVPAGTDVDVELAEQTLNIRVEIVPKGEEIGGTKLR